MIKLKQLRGDGTWEVQLAAERVLAARDCGSPSAGRWTEVDMDDGRGGVRSYEVRETPEEVRRLIFEASPLRPEVIAAKVAVLEAQLSGFRTDALRLVEAADEVKVFLENAQVALAVVGEELERLQKKNDADHGAGAR